MSRLGAFLVSLLIVVANAAAERTALIFISPEAAGPKVDIHTYIHPNWVLWPAPIGDEGLNRLLSVAFGADFLSEPGDAEFRQLGEGKPWVSTGFESLKSRGFYQARSERLGSVNLVAVESPGLTISHAALVVALGPDGTVQTAPFKAAIPPNVCAVYGARGWDDATELAKKVDRSLIVEYAPAGTGDRWTRMWLFGTWPDGLPTESGVPGLVRASNLLALLQYPARPSWTVPRKSWTGANRWLEFVRITGVEVQAVVGVVTFLVLALAVSAVSREKHSKLAMSAIKLALLVPSALVLSGNLAYAFGLAIWLPLFVSVVGLESFLSWLISRLLSRQNLHELFGLATVSLCVATVSSPLWSFYSPVLGHISEPYTPQWLAVLSASLAGVLALGFGINKWLLHLLGTLALGCSWLLSPSHEGVPMILQMAGFVAGTGLINGVNLGVLAFLSSDLLYLRHWAWTPAGLLHDYSQRGAVDVSRHVLFFASFGFVAFCMTVAMSAMMADKFFWHEAKLAWRRKENRTLFSLSGFAAIQGVANPEMLTAAYYIVVAAILALLYDCLRAV